MPIPQAILARDDVFHTVPAMAMNDAFVRVNQIERQNLAALVGLQGDPLEIAFYNADAARLNRYEWGVAREANGINPDCILIAGGAAGVNWAAVLAAGVVPLAHSHPYHEATVATTRAIAGGAIPWDNINGTAPAQNLGERLKIFPSAGDAEFCSANELATHRVETPYVVVTSPAGVRHIANQGAHPAFAAAPRLIFQIENVRPRNAPPIHTRCDLTAMQGTNPFWVRKDIDVTGHAGAGLVL